MRAFRRDASGDLVARFDRDEVGVLRHLALELQQLLDGSANDEGTEAGAPTDPALARLLPEAYREDPEASADFRRFTGPDLAGRKIANARAVVAALDAGDGSRHGRVFAGLGEVGVRLDGAAAQAWLRSLTDMRLALAERLGVADEAAGAEQTDGERIDGAEAVRSVYDWLGGVQDSLVRAVDR